MLKMSIFDVAMQRVIQALQLRADVFGVIVLFCAALRSYRCRLVYLLLHGM